MLRLASYDIVFQEIPGEVTLALNLSGCPYACSGCHSPHLREDSGEPLDEGLLGGLLSRYGQGVSCVCFMGGDRDPGEVARLASFVRAWSGAAGEARNGARSEARNGGASGGIGGGAASGGALKTGWYSGREVFPEEVDCRGFDYVKLGPYVEALGGLECSTTNQRLFRVDAGRFVDITGLFWRDA